MESWFFHQDNTCWNFFLNLGLQNSHFLKLHCHPSQQAWWGLFPLCKVTVTPGRRSNIPILSFTPEHHLPILPPSEAEYPSYPEYPRGVAGCPYSLHPCAWGHSEHCRGLHWKMKFISPNGRFGAVLHRIFHYQGTDMLPQVSEPCADS